MHKQQRISLLIFLLLFCSSQQATIAGIAFFPALPDTLPESGFTVKKTTLPVGIGSGNERFTTFRIVARTEREYLTSVDLDLSATDRLADLSGLYLYFNGYRTRLNTENAALFGAASRISAKLKISGEVKLNPGDNYFWITADVSPDAVEGNRIDISVISYTKGDGSKIDFPSVVGSRSIILTHKLLFSGGDYGSAHYRIPALITANDGSLVTATDKRLVNHYDLPHHIDLVIRRSTDRGRSWSEPFTLAGEGSDTGFGDAALVCDRKSGDILCLFASGKGFMTSLAHDPIRIFQSRSADHGNTWSEPDDLTSSLYGAECADPVTKNWQGAFISSGNAVQIRTGRILVALVVRETTDPDISNFVMYSDDLGRSWKVSTHRITAAGNEAKIVELNNGDLLMSIRSFGRRLFSISKDQGITWGKPVPQLDLPDPSCNGSLVRYTSLYDGYHVNRLLHSIPYADSRSNLSVLLSYDEGLTWPVRKTIYQGLSAYSSLAVLRDGSVGMYYEVGEYETYQMYFARFSLKWLTNGADTWVPKLKGIEEESPDIIVDSEPMLVWPNPATDLVHIQGDFDGLSSAEIISATGSLIRRFPINQTAVTEFSVTGIPPGLYFVRAGTFTARLVVQ